MEIINWVAQEDSGSWNRPNLVAYALLEAMAQKGEGEDITQIFEPFDPKALNVEFKVNGVEVSFVHAMTLIQNAVLKLEEDIKASIIKEAANKLIDELRDKVEGWD